MKKIFLGALVAVALYSCNKTAGGNKEIIEATPGDTISSEAMQTPVDSATVTTSADSTIVK